LGIDPPKGESRAARSRVSALVALATVLAGCSHLPHPHWPFHHRSAWLEAAHEVVIMRADGTVVDLPQFWLRNTLVVDLQNAGPQGALLLQPREHTVWPVRLAFRIRPGQFPALEVQARQRVVLPITPSGSQPLVLELDPGVYVMKTPQIEITWGPGTQSSGT
jgi:hypothetical protein